MICAAYFVLQKWTSVALHIICAGSYSVVSVVLLGSMLRGQVKRCVVLFAEFKPRINHGHGRLAISGCRIAQDGGKYAGVEGRLYHRLNIVTVKARISISYVHLVGFITSVMQHVNYIKYALLYFF
jgi:hypothetical protein